jgi:hypothetical protein
MKNKFTKKNISKKILDVFAPGKISINEKIKTDLNSDFIKSYKPEKEKINLNSNHNFKWLILILLFIIFLGIIFSNTKLSLPKIYLKEEEKEFNALKNVGIENDFNQNGDFKNLVQKFPSLFSLLAKNFLTIPGFLQEFYKITNEVNNLKNSFPQILSSENNPVETRNSVVNIYNSLLSLDNYLNALNIKDVLPSDLFLFKTYLNRFSNFLKSFISWMDEDKNHHLLVMFLNNSEMRPGGGFLGSYADVNLKNWKIESIKILDINEPDKELNLKVIPPKPLWGILKSWKSADANWFFDFASSSEKFIYFLENSDFYKKDNINFEGTIAITPKFLSDVLEIIGPIEINKNLSLNSENFLYEIQKNIEEQRQNKENNPKNILSLFWEKLLEKNKNLTEEQKNAILNAIFSNLESKDITLYFKNKEFQSFFENFDFAGRQQKLTSDFFGDYLAIADANPGSGKSDIFIKRNINFKIQISNEGILRNVLEIERKNTASEKDFWWYKRPNIDYIQIFTPKNIEVLDVSGGENKKIYPKINYSKENYIKDSYLDYENTEKTNPVFPQIKIYDFNDKNIISSWLTTPMQNKSLLKIEYSRKLPDTPSDNKKFYLIIDKQIGSSGNYNIEIEAPPGFVFKENNLSFFEYKTNDLPKKLIIELTLVKVI